MRELTRCGLGLKRFAMFAGPSKYGWSLAMMWEKLGSDPARYHIARRARPASGLAGKTCSQDREGPWRVLDFGRLYDAHRRRCSQDHGVATMPLRLYKRGSTWHYRGTIGPVERRERLGGSCKTGDRDTAARQVAEIEARYWRGHFD